MCLFHGAAKLGEPVLLEFSIDIPYRGTVGDCEDKLVSGALLGVASNLFLRGVSSLCQSVYKCHTFSLPDPLILASLIEAGPGSRHTLA